MREAVNGSQLSRNLGATRMQWLHVRALTIQSVMFQRDLSGHRKSWR